MTLGAWQIQVLVLGTFGHFFLNNSDLPWVESAYTTPADTGWAAECKTDALGETVPLSRGADPCEGQAGRADVVRVGKVGKK